MQLAEWIKEARKAGWLVRQAGSYGNQLHLHCAKQGCLGTLSVSLANPGPAPAPCNFQHAGQYSAHTFELYSNLVAQLRRRRLQLGLSQEDVNAAAGLADGHVSKLEALHRVAQFDTLKLWAQTVGFAIAITPAPLPERTGRRISAYTAPPSKTCHTCHDAGKEESE